MGTAPLPRAAWAKAGPPFGEITFLVQPKAPLAQLEAVSFHPVIWETNPYFAPALFQGSVAFRSVIQENILMQLPSSAESTPYSWISLRTVQFALEIPCCLMNACGADGGSMADRLLTHTAAEVHKEGSAGRARRRLGHIREYFSSPAIVLHSCRKWPDLLHYNVQCQGILQKMLVLLPITMCAVIGKTLMTLFPNAMKTHPETGQEE